MDYAMAKVLNRLAIPRCEDRRKALESAEDLFSRIARGDITPESISVDGETDPDSRPANSPSFAPPTPQRLLD